MVEGSFNEPWIEDKELLIVETRRTAVAESFTFTLMVKGMSRRAAAVT
jgi:hypothetical protein